VLVISAARTARKRWAKVAFGETAEPKGGKGGWGDSFLLRKGCQHCALVAAVTWFNLRARNQPFVRETHFCAICQNPSPKLSMFARGHGPIHSPA